MKVRSSRACWKAAATTAGLLAASTAQANYFCQGVVDQIDVSPSGLVTVDSAAAGLQFQYLCMIGTTTNGVSPDTCKSLLAVLTTAFITQQQVQWAFSDSLTCTTHPAWNWLAVWYWGPNLIAGP